MADPETPILSAGLTLYPSPLMSAFPDIAVGEEPLSAEKKLTVRI